ncbi:helix-turn-helix domain-containing protein [Demequina sp. SYSU T00068]|uniref:helix-turn-helix domain-containing protein n=1 Tax=Demequina lignilytica TaxID=3051663 RepID=UPI00262999E5|nr:helix-turn-helix domain-containing protein [Demequina sp. SYSU T00068]MDN4489700.1 helix-turn-helix domain-containing protein [Demequina sp. SYSU T00068]
MSDELARSADSLRAALDASSGSVEASLQLPRETAEKVLTLLTIEQSVGAVVVPLKELFTTTEAANLLGVSRPTLMKLIDMGDIEHVMVGTHHRIPASAIREYQLMRHESRSSAAESLNAFASDATAAFRSNVRFGSRSEAANPPEEGK